MVRRRLCALGGIYTYVGQPARSIPLLRTALRLNPDGGYLYFLLLGRAYLFENDIEQALINLREALRRIRMTWKPISTSPRHWWQMAIAPRPNGRQTKSAPATPISRCAAGSRLTL